MRRITSLLKKEMVTGFLLLAPVVGTGYLVYWLVGAVDALFPHPWRPRVAGYPLPGLGLIAVAVAALLLGVLAHNLAGQRTLDWFDRLVQRIPVFGSTYGLLKQVVEAVFSTGSNSFKQAVLIEYPSRGSWTVAFVTQAHAGDKLAEATEMDVVSVFVPTTPNPTSGFFLLVERSRVRELDMPVEQAFKLVLTMGIAEADAEILVTTGKWNRESVLKP